LLAIILRVGQGTFKEGVLGQNASDFARTLLKDFHGLRGLDRAHVQDLLKVPGLGPAKVAQIKATFELGKKARGEGQKGRGSGLAIKHFRNHNGSWS
jgi:DNA repair protein RadC